MQLIELEEWELTPFEKEKFEGWVGRLSHHDFVDVRNEDINFTRLDKPLSEATVALVSTGGLRTKTQPPYDLLDHSGDWSIRPIPSDLPVSELTIDHSHYNHGDADDDPNCMFPLERLRDLAEQGFVGGLAPTSVGMMGFVPNGTRVVGETGPAIADVLEESQADVVLLTGG